MLALVTCHISPPSIWYGKKWIQEKMNSWHLTSRLTARSFSEPTASRVRSGRCPRQCATLLHGQMYSIFRKKTPVLQFGHALEFVPSFPIYGWLTWWCDFFPVGPTFEDYPLVFSQKKVQPLGFYFWHLRLGLFKSPFLVGEAEHVWSVPLLQGQMYFQKKKRLFCNLGALTQNSWIRPIMSYLWMIGLEMRLFSCGPTFEDYPLVFSQKKVQPLGFYFWHLRLGLFKSLFWLVKLNMCVCTLLQGQMYFQKKKRLFCNLGALTQNSWIRPIMSYLWMIGLEMRLFSCGPTFEDYPLVFSQKKVQPLGFYFWHLRLGLFKSLFWLVKLNMCVCTLLQGQLYFQQKNMCFAIWARVDTKFLNSSHHVLSVDDWPGDATFFPVGPTFEDHPKYSVKKGPAPWILFLTRAPRPLEVTFFCWWRWTYVVVPFCKVM